MNYWEKRQPPYQQTAPQETQVEHQVLLDEEVVAEIEQNQELDIFDEEDEDVTQTMLDANLRLEMGRLYQMVLQGNIFADTDADPKAIKNVNRQIRKFVRGEMEMMLGIRQAPATQEAVIVKSDFNELEMAILKKWCSTVSKGATEKYTPQEEPAPQPPKKDGITAISGNLRPKANPTVGAVSPKKELPKAQTKQQPKQAATKSALNKEEESNLKKPISEMTPEELAAHNAAAEQRSLNKKSALPANMLPHPTPAQLEQMYTIQAASAIAPIANPWRVNQ